MFKNINVLFCHLDYLECLLNLNKPTYKNLFLKKKEKQKHKITVCLLTHYSIATFTIKL